MMKIITVRDIDKFADTIVPTPSKANKKKIESILQDVKKNGDFAVKKYEKKFAGYKKGSLKVSKREIRSAYSKVSKDQINALKIAQKSLSKTESAIKKRLGNFEITTDGVKIRNSFLQFLALGVMFQEVLQDIQAH